MIFLPTVRHSGTCFLLDLFKEGGYKLVNLDRMMLGGEHLPLNGKAIIHTHIDVNLPVVKAMHAKHPKPAHALAISYYERMNAVMIRTFAEWMPTLIPMRDPLLSIITRHTRHPEQGPHTYLVDSWRRIPKGAFFVPVDLGPRPFTLHTALDHCGVPLWPGFAAYAKAWNPVNSVPGGTGARAAYAARDARWFEEYFPEEWAALRAADDVKALFKREGYEDLLWW